MASLLDTNNNNRLFRLCACTRHFLAIIFNSEKKPHLSQIYQLERNINRYDVTDKLAHPDVSVEANNVSHYLLISPITSHNILLLSYWSLPLITGACPSWHSRQFSSISMDIKIPRTRESQSESWSPLTAAAEEDTSWDPRPG